MARRLEEGAILAGFRLERLLGAGGMGAVYLATDERLKRRVALKVVAPELADDARYRTRFLLEAELAARLDHPAIVPIFQMGEADGQLFLAMRCVEGGTLTRHLEELGALTPRETVALLAPVADALDAAHAAGLIHRDVKPGNILLEDGRPYLADFGLARPAADAADSMASAVGTQLSGTLGYLSPEQIEGHRLTSAVDQYALACVAFQCLTGRKPFEGDDLGIVYAHLVEPPPSAVALQRDLPRAVDAVLGRGLAKAPEDRYPTCTELIHALAEACGLHPRVPVERRSRRRRLLTAGALGALLATAGGLIAQRSGSGGTSVAGARPADPVFVVDAVHRTVSPPIDGGPTPSDIAEGGGAIWVLNGQNRSVTELDAKTHAKIGSPIGVGGSPMAITYGEGAAWVTATAASLPNSQPATYAGSVVEIDPATHAASLPIPLPAPASQNDVLGGGGIWAGGGGVWVVDAVGDVVRIDPASHQTTSVTHGLKAWTVVGDAGSVWALGDARILDRLDPDTGKVIATRRAQEAGGDLGSPAVGGGAVWVPSQLDGTIRRVDIATGKPRDFRGHPNIEWLQYVGGRIWGIDGVDGLMVELDPATGKLRTTRIRGQPVSFMATPQDVAVATNGVRCAPLETAPGVHPALTIVSDFPLTGQNGPDGVPLADATLAVLRAHRFRAGRFTVGYRSCDYGLVNGAWSDAICSAHARAFAANPSVVGVIGTWHSGCAADEIPILARAQPPVPMISPANNGDGLTHNGRPNYLRVATTDAEQYAAVVTFAAGLGKHRFYAVGDDAFWLLGGVDVPAARLGVRVIDAADWAHDDGDATRLAHRVASSHADAVLLDGSHGEDEGRTIRALRRVLGPTVPMIAMRAIPITDITASAGPAAEGMYVVSEAPPAASLTRRGRAWLLQFAASERTNTAGSLSPLAAQATEAMLDAIAGSDGTRTGVLRALRTAHVTGGILPDFSFTPGGDITPARFTVLRLRAGTPAGGDVQPDFGGAAVVGSFTVPLFDAGLAPTRGTPIGITLGREPAADAEATCGNPGQADCHFAGAFTAGDTTTARLLCPTGRTIEDERDQPQGYWVFGHRTLSCPDGSSLTMSVRLVVGGGITGDQVTNFGWEWVITGGTGRLARVRGDGISFEPRDAGHNILRGHMTGVVHL